MYSSHLPDPGFKPSKPRESGVFSSSMPNATRHDWDVLCDAHDWSGVRPMCWVPARVCVTVVLDIAEPCAGVPWLLCSNLRLAHA
jgi:hypothetical protein